MDERERQFWLDYRRGLLQMNAAIEKRLGVAPHPTGNGPVRVQANGAAHVTLTDGVPLVTVPS